MVMQLPDGDQTSMSRKQMIARLDVCMGGRVAEELVFGNDDVTSGASNDLMQATRLARAMVTKYGLSERVGVMFLDDDAKQSGQTMKQVDDEVKELVTASYNRAKHLLETHRKELNFIAQGLMEYESLSGAEIAEAANGKFPSRTGIRSQKPSRETQAFPAPKSTTASARVAHAAADSSSISVIRQSADASSSNSSSGSSSSAQKQHGSPNAAAAAAGAVSAGAGNAMAMEQQSREPPKRPLSAAASLFSSFTGKRSAEKAKPSANSSITAPSPKDGDATSEPAAVKATHEKPTPKTEAARDKKKDSDSSAAKGE